MTLNSPDVITVTLYDKKFEGAIKGLGMTYTAYKIPRNELKRYANNADVRPDLEGNPGIYFIFGNCDGEFNIYVGQADIRYTKDGKKLGLLNRVHEHDTVKEAYWDTAIMVYRKTYPLDSTDLNYLENLCEDELRKIYNDNCKNKNKPHSSGIVPEKKIPVGWVFKRD